MRRLLVLLALFLIPMVTKAQETRQNLLAFTLIQLPGTFTPDENVPAPYGYQEIVYLYDPQQETIQPIGTGDGLRWSPSGRYLAIADTYNEMNYSGLKTGKMRGFTVHDLDTGTMQKQSADDGDYLGWSPREVSLAVVGSMSHGLNGSNAWVDFYNADGSGEPAEEHLTFVGGILGSHGGTFPLGWMGDQLLVSNQGVQPNGYNLYDPLSKVYTSTEIYLPWLGLPLRYDFGDRAASTSPDNRYTAVSQFDYPWNVTADFATYLLIVDMATGDTHKVELPVTNGAVITHMAWRSCHLPFDPTKCAF